jgi:SAM-dependent methyltransferase
MAAFQDHFSGHAASYAAYRPTYPKAMFEWLARESPSRAFAWDCATGNGQAAVLLAEFFDHVEATDASEGQIANATPHPRVTYRVAESQASGLADDSVDLVTVAQALHWLPFEGFYREAERVLKPGGLLAVWGYNFYFCDHALDGLLREVLYPQIASYWPPDRKWVDERYRTVPFPFAEVRTPEFFIEVHWTVDDLVGYITTWSAVQRWRKALGDDGWVAAERAIRAAWVDGDRRKFLIPMDLRVGRVG